MRVGSNRRSHELFCEASQTDTELGLETLQLEVLSDLCEAAEIPTLIQNRMMMSNPLKPHPRIDHHLQALSQLTWRASGGQIPQLKGKNKRKSFVLSMDNRNRTNNRPLRDAMEEQYIGWIIGLERVTSVFRLIQTMLVLLE